MKLSDLLYLVIKNAIYYDDYSFIKETFLKGEYNDDPDYAQNIINVFSPINEAIARLSDLERINYIVEIVSENNNIIDLTDCEKDVKEVVSLAQLNNGKYEPIPFKMFGAKKLFVSEFYNKNLTTFIEYKEDIPIFSEEHCDYIYDNEGTLISSKDVDLKDHGITSSMCNYIIEYAVGKLKENSGSLEEAAFHVNRAEQYFSGIKQVASAFPQRSVRPVHTIRRKL